MRLVHGLVVAAVVAVAVPAAPRALQMDPDRVVPGGGISAPGWKGKIDAGSVRQGRNINDSKFTMTGNTIEIAAGPAAVYWNPANTASGDYTVKATFKEPKYMSANSHPHPYGVFIGGNKMDTEQMSLLYCSPYGNGSFIVRGFTAPPAGATQPGPAAFQMGGRAPQPSEAVHKAAADGSVTQEVALSVKGDKVSCSINGTEVASYAKSDVVAPGKLESTDGIYGIRVSHNLDVTVTGFGMSK